MERFGKIAIVGTTLAFLTTQLPFKAHIDVPLFYVTSLGALVIAAIGALLA